MASSFLYICLLDRATSMLFLELEGGSRKGGVFLDSRAIYTVIVFANNGISIIGGRLPLEYRYWYGYGQELGCVGQLL
ncbi:hypothetical protein F4677DRAFT_399733 [Hypoxylon crocopeplum]|nr:hypothetical protein F4677DRAFT_399733 [Hypoxylon crocopeplum]